MNITTTVQTDVERVEVSHSWGDYIRISIQHGYRAPLSVVMSNDELSMVRDAITAYLENEGSTVVTDANGTQVTTTETVTTKVTV